MGESLSYECPCYCYLYAVRKIQELASRWIGDPSTLTEIKRKISHNYFKTLSQHWRKSSTSYSCSETRFVSILSIGGEWLAHGHRMWKSSMLPPRSRDVSMHPHTQDSAQLKPVHFYFPGRFLLSINQTVRITSLLTRKNSMIWKDYVIRVVSLFWAKHRFCV